jgi:aminoglycoside/choline kinase family phosphotransferase
LGDILTVEAGVEYRMPRYDMDALLIEAELLLDWYLPKLEVRVTDAKRNAYRILWRDALLPVTDGTQTWVLRDFHSPNLLWLPEREGTGRIGLLDFQASLLQDARVNVPETMEIALLSRYTRARLAASAAFDAPRFARAYATLAAQRASKILGIFTRLERRDRKPQYLRHLPRVWGYLQRSLAHPDLAPLAAWYRANVPPLKV